MDFITVIIGYLIIFLECFVWWRLIDNVLEAKYSKLHTIYAAVGLLFFMVMKEIVFESPEISRYSVFGTLVLMIYSMVMIILLFQNSFVEKIIWLGIYNIGLIVMEIITILILNLVMDKSLDSIPGDRISGYVILLGKLMLIPLFELIIRRRKGRLFIGAFYFRELSVVIVLNAILFLFMVYIFNNKHKLVDTMDQVILFMFGIVLFITVYTVVIVSRMEKKSREELAVKLKIQEISLELKQNEDMVIVMDKLRKLRHDMNNHIGLMKTLINAGNYDELSDYMDQMYEDVAAANELVITGNRTVSVLVNAKKALAKTRDIDFNSLITASEINMQSKDICALLGNILDNAIEAAEKSDGKKYIDLMIQKTQEGCIITCENSIGVKPVVKKNKFQTSKDNSNLHGIGTDSIKDVVSKYKGQINYDYDDDMFRARVVLQA